MEYPLFQQAFYLGFGDGSSVAVIFFAQAFQLDVFQHALVAHHRHMGAPVQLLDLFDLEKLRDRPYCR